MWVWLKLISSAFNSGYNTLYLHLEEVHLLTAKQKQFSDPYQTTFSSLSAQCERLQYNSIFSLKCADSLSFAVVLKWSLKDERKASSVF